MHSFKPRNPPTPAGYLVRPHTISFMGFVRREFARYYLDYWDGSTLGRRVYRILLEESMISVNPGDLVLEKLLDHEVAKYIVLNRRIRRLSPGEMYESKPYFVEYETLILWVAPFENNTRIPGDTWYLDSFNLRYPTENCDVSWEVLVESGLSWIE